MQGQQSVRDLLTTQNVDVDIVGFLINLALAAVLGSVLAIVYGKLGTSLSNRRLFARNFVLLAVTTTLVISVVKSSLALSLGLVGALSVIRFRSAIKDPEELSYLFLAIAIGLGFGAGQRQLTLAAFAVIITVIAVTRFFFSRNQRQNLFLTVSSSDAAATDLDSIVPVLERHCSLVNLRRFDSANGHVEAAFEVEFPSYRSLVDSKSDLRKLDDEVKITFVDNAGLL